MSSTQRRSFSSQFKLETVVEYLQGHKPTVQICRERDITENLLYRWKQQFYERAPHLFDQNPTQPNHDAAQERIAELERMVGRLTMELDILKKAGTLLTSRSNGNAR